MELAVFYEAEGASKLVKWKIKPGSFVNTTSILCHCESEVDKKTVKIKCHQVGTVLQLKAKEGQTVRHGDMLVTLEGCSHPTVMKDMCAECGADLREECGMPGERKSTSSASVAMVHSIPELIVSQKEAQQLGHEDEKRLLGSRKLVLLVDLDQTLLHTTNDNIPSNLKDAYHFQLWHRNANIWYHTKFRPGTMEFLENISQIYELHICTFGVRMYAHKIASFLDPDGKLFSHRILSRDECFNPTSKTANLKALFPCGDRMVCIIDDREDVWGFAPNLIHVRPYIYFDGTADINAPQGLDQETWEGQVKEKGEKVASDPKKKRRQVKVVRVLKKKAEGISREKDSGSSIPQLDSVTSGATSNDKDMESASKVEHDDEDSEEDSGRVIAKPDSGPIYSDDLALDNVMSVCQGAKEDGQVLPNKSTQDTNDPCPGKRSNNMEDTSEGKVGVDTSEEGDKSCGPITAGSPGDEHNMVLVQSKEGELCGPQVVPSGDKEGTDTLTEGTEVDYRTTDGKSRGPLQGIETSGQTPDGNELRGPAIETSGQTPDGNESRGPAIETSGQTPDGNESRGPAIETPDRCGGEYEEMVEWEDTDDYLIYLQDILHRIHKAYFKFYDDAVCDVSPGEEVKPPEIKTIVPYVKKKVLKGANIVFSGVFPNNKPPEKSQAYIVAKSLGANILSKLGSEDDCSGNVTHLVAARDQTEKVYEAKKRKGVVIVNPDWLWTCAYRWEWVDERLYPLTEETQVSRDSPKAKIKRKPKPDAPKGAESSATCGGSKGDGAEASEVTAADIEKRRFSDSYNPLFTFSKDDLDNMDKEVGDLIDDDDDDDDDDDKEDSQMEEEIRRKVLGFGKTLPEISSDEDSLSGEFPKGWDSRKRKRSMNGDDNAVKEEEEDEEETCDPEKQRKMFKLDDDDDDAAESEDDLSDSVGSVDEEIAAAVERELLDF